MKKILLVVRASTYKQETESQKLELKEYCNSLGYSDDEMEFIISSGASARKANKLYLKMLDDIKSTIINSPTINALAIWHINRLGRIESYLMQMKEWLIANKVQLYIKNPTLTLFNEDCTTVNPGTEIAFSVFSTMVKHETQELMEKMKRGKDRLRAEGRFADGSIAYGFKVGQDRFIAIDQETAPHILKIFNMYAEGQSATYCRDYLWKFGFHTSTTNIHRMLNNEKYRMIVGDELFDKVKALKKSKSVKHAQRSYNFGQKILVCGKCGHAFNADNDRYYCVYNKKNIYKDTRFYCDSSDYSQMRIDCCLAASTLRWYISYCRSNGDQRLQEVRGLLDELPKRIEVLHKEIAETDIKLERIGDAYAMGLWSKQKMLDKLALINKEKSSKAAEVDRLTLQKKALEEEIKKGSNVDVEHIQQLFENFEASNKVELYEIVHRMIDWAKIQKIGKYGYLEVHSIIYDSTDVYVWTGIGWSYKLWQINKDCTTEKEIDEAVKGAMELQKMDAYRRKYK